MLEEALKDKTKASLNLLHSHPGTKRKAVLLNKNELLVTHK